MNFVKNNVHVARKYQLYILVLQLIFLQFILLTGCSDQVKLPTAEELKEFENVGPLHPTSNKDDSTNDLLNSSPYRVSANEVLEMTMPAILQVVTVDDPVGSGQFTPYVCRISEQGTINLPVAGEIEVSGKTLAQIESVVIDAYYPEYTDTKPLVYVSMAETTELPMFSVLGLVNKPGNYPYPLNIQYNLMQALGFAGGMDRTAEPRYATIYRLKKDGSIASVILQVVNTGDESLLSDAMNIPIKPGDIIYVEHTPRTRTNEFLKGILRINIGTYLRIEDIWDED